MGNCVSAKGSKKDLKRLTEEEIRLLLDNTRLTRPEIIALHKNFLNECPSGKLTKKEFIKLYKEVHPSDNKREKADKFCEYVFKVIDQQKLGYITFKDFVLCFSLTSDGEFKDKCEFAFKLYDLDKDGKISKKEMTQVLEALYDLSGITDRKGDKAPAKKVEEIIKAINAKSELANADPTIVVQPIIVEESSNLKVQAPGVSGALELPSVSVGGGNLDATSGEIKVTAPSLTVAKTDAKGKKVKLTPEEKAAEKERKKQEKERLKQEKAQAKKEKAERAKLEKELKAKEKKELAALKKAGIKPPKIDKNAGTFITKDQFIEACNTDEGIKKLFVESIFCNQPSADASAGLEVSGDAIVDAIVDQAKSIDVTLPSIDLDISPNKLSSKTFTLKQTTTKTTTTSDGKVITETETITEKSNNNNNDDNDEKNKNEKNKSSSNDDDSDKEKKGGKKNKKNKNKNAVAVSVDLSNEKDANVTSAEEILDDLKKKVEVTVDNEKVEAN